MSRCPSPAARRAETGARAAFASCIRNRNRATLLAAVAAVASVVAAPHAFAAPLGLGRPALPEEIAAWDIDVAPDGAGLPEGAGDVLTGDEVFGERCASCHGDFAEGLDNWPELAGGIGTLDYEDPLKTVGSYWPHLTTAWDYVNRSMPFGDAQSLDADEVYAIIAYILYSNDLVEDDFVLSRENFLDVALPNADGFVIDDRPETEYPLWTGEPCMTDCKAGAEITMRARVLDVTPDQGGDGAADGDAGGASGTAVATAAAVAAPASSHDAALAAEGEKVFRKCKACHQVGEDAKNRTGPHLNGIVGAPAATADGFKYSKAMRAAADDGLVWTEESLAAYLANPRSFLKGTRMSFAGIKDEGQLAAVIEYLKSVTSVE